MPDSPAKKPRPTYAELSDKYSRMLTRSKKAQVAAKAEGERLMCDVMTLGASGLAGLGMGKLYQTGIDAATSAGLEAGTEDYDEKVKESTGIMGFDYDLVGGVVLTGLGMANMADKMSPTLRCLGVGTLSQFAGRKAFAAGLEMGEDDEG